MIAKISAAPSLIAEKIYPDRPILNISDGPNAVIDKEIFGYLSIILTIAAYAPYIFSTLRGTTKPHIFSWFLWSLLMAIAAAGQVFANAGPGAWATAISALACFIIMILSLKHGDKNIKRRDIVVFVAALCALPFWYLTQNPLTAILLITFIDALSYVPTFRKSYVRPHEEMAAHYLISNIKHALSIMAMSAYSLTTTLYPVVLFIMNLLLVMMIYWRRGQIRNNHLQ